MPDREDKLRTTLAMIAPGTSLRDGLERILRGNTGALIVLGHDKLVESLCTGGFPLDVEFSATGMRELAKMDGAVVLDTDGSRIVRAATQLMPDPSIPTEESGTRHRTAQRVSSQTGFPVISVSQSMRVIGLYVDGRRYVLDNSAAILSRANQALATLERYKLRLDEVSGTLSATELLDLGAVARALGYPATPESLETAVSPRGYRLLAKVPRLPATIVDRLVDHFGGLQKLLAASVDDLQTVDGVGESRARSVRESLSRLAESSILERYV